LYGPRRKGVPIIATETPDLFAFSVKSGYTHDNLGLCAFDRGLDQKIYAMSLGLLRLRKVPFAATLRCKLLISIICLLLFVGIGISVSF
jgi:hypothetical protein